jgi:hypothetical protein
MVRALDSLDWRALASTEGVASNEEPFWSWDSRFLVFSLGGKLKRVDVAGGPAQALCDFTGGNVRGGFWTRDGKIVFGANNSPLMQVAAGGGVPTPLFRLEAGELTERNPVLLPDGRHFLYSRASPGTDANGVFVGSLDAKLDQHGKRLFADRFVPHYVPSLEPGGGGGFAGAEEVYAVLCGYVDLAVQGLTQILLLAS